MDVFPEVELPPPLVAVPDVVVLVPVLVAAPDVADTVVLVAADVAGEDVAVPDDAVPDEATEPELAATDDVAPETEELLCAAEDPPTEVPGDCDVALETADEADAQPPHAFQPLPSSLHCCCPLPPPGHTQDCVAPASQTVVPLPSESDEPSSDPHPDPMDPAASTTTPNIP